LDNFRLDSTLSINQIPLVDYFKSNKKNPSNKFRSVVKEIEKQVKMYPNKLAVSLMMFVGTILS
ncbi:hypothetical protein DXA16_11540, partial [Streptococcus anginosus]